MIFKLKVKCFDNKPISTDVCPSVFTTRLHVNTLVHFRIISSAPYLYCNELRLPVHKTETFFTNRQSKYFSNLMEV